MTTTRHTIAIIGPKGAGKTQLHYQLGDRRKPFKEKQTVVSGTQVVAKKFSERDIQINYMDFGNDNELESINDTLASSNVNGICLVVDGTDSNWPRTIDTFLCSGIVIPASKTLILAVTKTDKSPSNTARLTQIETYVRNNIGSCQLIETSAKTGKNIDNLHDMVMSSFSKPLRFQSEVSVNFAEGLKNTLNAAQFGQVNLDDMLDMLSNADADAINDPKNQQTFATASRSAKSPKAPRSILHSADNSKSPISRRNMMLESDFFPDNPPVVSRSTSDSKTLTRTKDTDMGNSTSISTGSTSPDTSSNFSRLPPRSEFYDPPLRSAKPKRSWAAFTLQFAGMALILAALTSLLYLAIVALGFVSPIMLTTVVEHIVTAVGAWLGLASPTAVLAQGYAALGVTVLTGQELLVAAASLALLAMGNILRHPTTLATFSFALRLLGAALMLAALANCIYLILIASHVFSAAPMLAMVNQVLTVVGVYLGFSAPVAAFANASATLGLSTTTAAGVANAATSLLVGKIGQSLFNWNAPAKDDNNYYYERARSTLMERR